jgi:hypothetical protein
MEVISGIWSDTPACGSFHDFIDKGLLLTKFYGHRHDFVSLYGSSSLSKMTMDMFDLSWILSCPFLIHCLSPISPLVYSTRSFVLYVMFSRSVFVLFLLTIVLSVLLLFTDSDYLFGIFQLFFRQCTYIVYVYALHRYLDYYYIVVHSFYHTKF